MKTRENDGKCEMIGCNCIARYSTMTLPVRHYCFGCRPTYSKLTVKEKETGKK